MPPDDDRQALVLWHDPLARHKREAADCALGEGNAAGGAVKARTGEEMKAIWSSLQSLFTLHASHTAQSTMPSSNTATLPSPRTPRLLPVLTAHPSMNSLINPIFPAIDAVVDSLPRQEATTSSSEIPTLAETSAGDTAPLMQYCPSSPFMVAAPASSPTMPDSAGAGIIEQKQGIEVEVRKKLSDWMEDQIAHSAEADGTESRVTDSTEGINIHTSQHEEDDLMDGHSVDQPLRYTTKQKRSEKEGSTAERVADADVVPSICAPKECHDAGTSKSGGVTKEADASGVGRGETSASEVERDNIHGTVESVQSEELFRNAVAGTPSAPDANLGLDLLATTKIPAAALTTPEDVASESRGVADDNRVSSPLMTPRLVTIAHPTAQISGTTSIGEASVHIELCNGPGAKEAEEQHEQEGGSPREIREEDVQDDPVEVTDVSGRDLLEKHRSDGEAKEQQPGKDPQSHDTTQGMGDAASDDAAKASNIAGRATPPHSAGTKEGIDLQLEIVRAEHHHDHHHEEEARGVPHGGADQGQCQKVPKEAVDHRKAMEGEGMAATRQDLSPLLAKVDKSDLEEKEAQDGEPQARDLRRREPILRQGLERAGSPDVTDLEEHGGVDGENKGRGVVILDQVDHLIFSDRSEALGEASGTNHSTAHHTTSDADGLALLSTKRSSSAHTDDREDSDGSESRAVKRPRQSFPSPPAASSIRSLESDQTAQELPLSGNLHFQTTVHSEEVGNDGLEVQVASEVEEPPSPPPKSASSRSLSPFDQVDSGDDVKGQWRVGRLPGHQGSHIRRKDDANAVSPGSKRSASQMGGQDTDKILKKPFRLPVKVSLAPAQPKIPITPARADPVQSALQENSPNQTFRTPQADHQPMPMPARPSKPPKTFIVPRKASPERTPSPSFSTIQPAKTLARKAKRSFISLALASAKPIEHSSDCQDHQPGINPQIPQQAPATDTPYPTSSPSTSSPLPYSSPIVSSRARKPFKLPFNRSSAPSPMTPLATSSSSGSSRGRTVTLRERIMELEKQERTLRQALRYLGNPEEDDRLEELVVMWKAAGRQVAELLFDVTPKPDPSSEAENRGRGGWSGYGDSMGGMGGEGDLTDEQLEYLANAPTNDKGEPLDMEGNPIYAEVEELDLGQMLKNKKGSASGSSMPYGSASYGHAATQQQRSDIWDIGTMLEKIGVDDPTLFEWDAEAEDWAVEVKEDDDLLC